MKKSMNQSTLTMILNGGSIFALVVVIVLLFVYGSVSVQLDEANEDRFNERFLISDQRGACIRVNRGAGAL